MGCGGSCAPASSAQVLPQGVLPAQPDRAFHQLRMAQLNLYLDTVSRKPEAFVKAVERRRQDQGPINADGVNALSIRGLLAADERESRRSDVGA